MGGEFAVRFAIAADLAEVIALEQGVAEAPHWAETEYAAIVADDEGSGGAIRRCFFVAEAEERLIGFSVGKVDFGRIRVEGGVGELESVVVAVAARRSGVGRALCAAVVAWCRELGATALELEVRAGSAGAIALYAELGFVASERSGGGITGTRLKTL